MRIVSLVPSLTETVIALGVAPEWLVGRTPWCIHPAGVVKDVPVVGGTKTPTLSKIVRAEPDLVLLEREENRRETYDALLARGLREEQLWVGHVTCVADVPPMIRDLGARIGRTREADALAAQIDDARAQCAEQARAEHDAGHAPVRAVALIWHEPLMAVAASRYAGDCLVQAGFALPELGDGGGYPQVSAAELADRGIEAVLLTSEPHDFTPDEGEAIVAAIGEHGGEARWHKVDGEALTWFGARTATALPYWRSLLTALRDRRDG